MLGVIGAVGLLYSSDTPAPIVPPGDCTAGTAVALSLDGSHTSPIPLQVGSGWSPSFSVFDNQGHPLRNATVTLTAPTSGAGGLFVVRSGAVPGDYTLAPTVTINTGPECLSASVDFVTNETLGSYQLNASAGTAATSIALVNTSPLPITGISFSFGRTQITHIGSDYESVVVEVSPGRLNVPVTFSVPSGNVASGTFPGGATTATVLTDAFGRVRLPPLKANGMVGPFKVMVAAGSVVAEMGPFVNAAGTVTTLSREPFSLEPTVFGTPAAFVASVRFPGLPTAGYHTYPSLPWPGGAVVLLANGQQVDGWAIDLLSFSSYACRTCEDLTFNIPLTAYELPFGSYQITAEYQPAQGRYDASHSASLTQTIVPQFILPTADASVLSRIGRTDSHEPFDWYCTLRDAEWVPTASVTATLPPGGVAPLGILRYRIDDCQDNTGWGGYATQKLVIQFSKPLPRTSRFVAFGPTYANPSPHWYPVDSEWNGDQIVVIVSDGGNGDDDYAIGGVIAGKIALIQLAEAAPIPGMSAGAVAALVVLIGVSARQRVDSSGRRRKRGSVS